MSMQCLHRLPASLRGRYATSSLPFVRFLSLPTCHRRPLRSSPACKARTAHSSQPRVYEQRAAMLVKHSRAAMLGTQPVGHSRELGRSSRRLLHIAARAGGRPEQQEIASGYRMPPKEIAEIVDHPLEPNLSFSPDRTKVLQLDRPPPHPPITELARSELKLAGLRIDAQQWSRSRMSYNTALSLFDMTDDLVLPPPPGTQTRIHGIPDGYWLNYVTWSNDSRWLAFTLRSTGAADAPPRGPLQLWVADVETGTARPLLPDFGINSIFDDYVWLDEDTIIAMVIPKDVSPPPVKPPVPVGPKIQDNTDGKLAQGRTYPDLLKDEYDEDLFEYYTTSQLAFVKVSTGEVELRGPPRMYTDIDISPDNQWLLVSWIQRPFSFNVPCGRFPKTVELWQRDGQAVRQMVHLPLAEDIPIAFNSVRKGPRSLGFRSDQPAELCWIECQDGGDPGVQASPRDILYTSPAAEAVTNATPRVFAQTDLRCGGVAWGRGDLALVYESWWKTRRSVVWTIAPDNPEAGMKVLFDRNSEDAYSNPGSPAFRRLPDGSYVLAMVDDERKLLLQGTGASPEGNKPFLDLLDVDSGETQRLWQSTPPHLEYTSSLFCDLDNQPIRLDGLKLLLSRESAIEPPQIYIQSWTGPDAPPTERCLTDFPHPYPTLKNIQKEIVRYKRADGVDLSATLYLPPGYERERDGPLPCLLWAYPKEYKSKDAAGQIRTSPHQFTGIGSTSPLLWLARKYAILDGPAMPIVAEGDEEPNDTYVEQLTASARAAVEELDRRGVVDLARIAVGGHSYGAFMAANLLAHAPNLFACGIARSGAYNRTLTPFGFQAEERTIWQATQTYITMSPFLQADKIKKPLLLIHGEDDNNTGTFPMQSERFYAALKGHGAPCKLVLLPHESHSYRARESIMHTLYEMDAWMEQYCVASPGASEAGVPAGVSQNGNGAAPVQQPVSKL